MDLDEESRVKTLRDPLIVTRSRRKQVTWSVSKVTQIRQYYGGAETMRLNECNENFTKCADECNKTFKV